jgi:hypothetical protein
MKKISISIFTLLILIFSVPGISTGGQGQQAKQRVIRIGIAGAPAGSSTFSGSSISSLYQQYGSSLSSSSSSTSVINFGAKLNAASIGTNPNVQNLVQSTMAAISAGGNPNLSSLLQSGLTAMNSGTGQSTSPATLNTGNVNLSALLQSISLQTQSAALSQNGMASPAPGSYGPTLAIPVITGVGAALSSSPMPGSYSLLASQTSAASTQGGIAPALYANPAPSISPTVGNYNLGTSQAATLLAYTQAYMPNPSNTNQLTGQVVDVSTVLNTLQGSISQSPTQDLAALLGSMGSSPQNIFGSQSLQPSAANPPSSSDSSPAFTTGSATKLYDNLLK